MLHALSSPQHELLFSRSTQITLLAVAHNAAASVGSLRVLRLDIRREWHPAHIVVNRRRQPHPYPFTPRPVLTPVRRAVAVEGGAGTVVAVGAVVSVEL
jgi:hypothetical protein